MIGKNAKGILKELKFNFNRVTDTGFIKLLKAIEEVDNSISELSLFENEITDDGAFFFYNWLKKLRQRGKMSMVSCDLNKNKVMHKALNEVES